MNKRGSMMDGILWIIFAFITLIVFGGLALMYNLVYDGLHDVGTVGNLNVTNITETVFDATHNQLMNQMNILAFLILCGGAFSILVHNFLVRQHPAWLIVYILITVVAIILSAYVSNAYMDVVLQNEVLGSTLQEFTMGNFIMQWLPYWSAIIGIFGAIFLFIGTLRDRELGGIY